MRAWLDGEVFLRAPLTRAPRKRRALGALLAAPALGAVVLARMWPSRPLNSIWAEDGVTWLGDSLHRAFLATLTTPYDGYLQTNSRILGKVVSLLPVRLYAGGMAVAGAAVVAACALLVFYASAAYVPDPIARATLAALVALVPVADVELLANVVNAIWFLFFVAFWVLLWRPATRVGVVVAALVLLLSTLSNIGVLILTPLWALRALAVRDRRDGIIVGAFAAGALIQLGLSYNDLNVSGEPGTIRGTLAPHWSWGLVPAYLQRIVGAGLLSNEIAGWLWRRLGTILEIVLGGVLVGSLAGALRLRDRGVRLLVVLGVGISVLLFLVSGYQRWRTGGSQFLWPHGSSNDGSSRYMVVPALLLVSALALAVGRAPRYRLAAGSAVRLRIGAGVILGLALFSFNIGDPTERGVPTWTGALRASAATCNHSHLAGARVQVAPALIPNAFAVGLRCSDIRSAVK